MADKEKPRGGCLSTFLVVMMIANAGVAIIYAKELFNQHVHIHIPTWALISTGIFGLVNFCASMAMWRWRKWGVYTFCGLAPIIFLINISLHISPYQALAGFLGPLILIALVRRVWPQME